MVPVLSRHKVSTRAKVSTEYISWTRTLRIPSLITAVKRDVTVSKAIPFGNIPRRAVEEFTTESLIGSILINNASKEEGKAKWDDNFTSEARNFR